MKKFAFYMSALIALMLLVNIAEILISDLNRLTEYGYGYLFGKVILFICFLAISLRTKKHVFKPNTPY
ncbi:hypothetical protein ACFSQP_04210 [Bizionia sediminis]|uniref:Uncharacterized protein n=1 Tax=Bizionia sediminis TaxID=1737064 RepID=A0ABW5KRQ3_9FLAO